MPDAFGEPSVRCPLGGGGDLYPRFIATLHVIGPSGPRAFLDMVHHFTV